MVGQSESLPIRIPTKGDLVLLMERKLSEEIAIFANKFLEIFFSGRIGDGGIWFKKVQIGSARDRGCS
jgi:hypothetical protein